MQGLAFDRPVAKVNQKAVEEGLLVIQAAGNVIRLLPPLIVEEQHIDEMVERFERVLAGLT